MCGGVTPRVLSGPSVGKNPKSGQGLKGGRSEPREGGAAAEEVEKRLDGAEGGSKGQSRAGEGLAVYGALPGARELQLL